MGIFEENKHQDSSIRETISQWMQTNYIPQQSAYMQMLYSRQACCNLTVLRYIDLGYELPDGWRYRGYEEHECSVISPVINYTEDRPDCRTGALLFHFEHETEKTQFEVLHTSAWESDEDIGISLVSIAAVPDAYIEQWLAFEKECDRIASSALPFREKVYIVGGMNVSVDTTVDWEDIYLPEKLKSDILQDIDAFFEKGVKIYNRLKLSPFRKLLFAGVPGTGKTMLCSAIAGWALAKDYFVVYVSGANEYGAQFWKIHRALKMAANAEMPTIVIVEELDAYLDEDSKAELLNVLDGSETPINEFGTLLIATTNHPEIIDDRVMKRPGRLDRVFIIPELQAEEDAERMLREYLGESWQDEHRAIVPKLLNRPGAFVREIALYALTMAAYRDIDGLPLDLLEESLNTLVDQIEAKDDFLTAHKRRNIGLLDLGNGRNR